MSTPTGDPGQPYGSGDPSDTSRQQYGEQQYGQPQYGEQQQYGQAPYPSAGYGGAPPQAPRNGVGITALVLGIIGLLLSPTVILSWLGALLGLVAIILGIVGMGRANKGRATNRGVAIGGLVTGILAFLVGVGFTLFTVFAFNAVGGGDLIACLQQAGPDQAAQQQCQTQFQEQANQVTGS